MGNVGASMTPGAETARSVDDCLSETSHRRPGVTVVVPTRNEATNVVELVARLDAALGDIPAEILFVDDSDDETPEVISSIVESSAREVRLLHREIGRRSGGLGGAVLAGYQVARGTHAVVIDGDLQHPPEVVPALLDALGRDDVDLAYGTRYEATGEAAGLSGAVRHTVSRSSTRLAKMLFPRRLRDVSDPMSGFFAVRLDALDLPTMRPNGYKILLEILTGSRLRGVVGVPFSFQPRHSGESKASLAEGVRFGLQLMALRMGATTGRLTQFLAFAAVGISGVAVNTFVMWALLHLGALAYLPAAIVSTNVAIVWNFALLQAFVFRSRVGSLAGRLTRFWVLNAALLPVQLALLALLVEAAGMQPLAANVVVLSVVFVLRYAFSRTLVFHDGATERPSSNARHRGAARRSAPAVFYLTRIVPVAAIALVASPAVTVHAWRLIEDGGWADVAFVVVAVCAAVLISVCAAPGANEPDVHDRQLDIILAVPLLGAAAWLTLGWPTSVSSEVPLTAADVMGFVAFLIGTALIVLGTRLTMRLRWVLALPLLALPAVVDRPVVLVGLVVAALLGTMSLWSRRRGEGWAGARSAHDQRLPNHRLAAGLTAVMAVALAAIAISQSGAPDAPWSLVAAVVGADVPAEN